MLLPVLTTYEKENIRNASRFPTVISGCRTRKWTSASRLPSVALGSRLVILGHHYQRDEVIKFADYTGDSFKLAQQVSRHPDADFIVFCGVHFMAESADVLSADHQQVVLPDLAAGCSMADMADIEQPRDMLERPRANGVVERRARSPTSTLRAAVKAFCGERGGVVCTSSNAAATLRWAWERGKHILFLPDQHLGRNTAYRMGVPLDQMVVWIRARSGAVWKLMPSRIHESFSGRDIVRFTRASPSGRSRTFGSKIPVFASSHTLKCRGMSSRPRTIAAPPNTSSSR